MSEVLHKRFKKAAPFSQVGTPAADKFDKMKNLATLCLFSLVCGPTALWATDPPKEPPCLEPFKGPMWLQDFNSLQKSELKLKWKPSEKDNTVKYTIRGKYPEALDTNRTYARYKHVSEIEAEEIWLCDKDKVSTFKSIDGTVESELNWRSETVDTKQTYEAENNFLIKGPDDYRHVKHESRHETEVRSETLTKDADERTEWTQVWEPSGMPVIRGKIREKTTEKYFLADGMTRQLASPITIPGYDAAPLASDVQLTVEKETKATLNGPIDPTSIVTRQTIKQIKQSKVVETKEIQSTQSSEYFYNPKGKKYEFVKMAELYDEKVVNPDQGFKTRYARLDTWTDPENPPTKTSFWKETYRKSKFGGSAELTLSSKGHGLIPQLFNLDAKEGTYSRLTDYSSAGRIVRFQVLLFPEGGKQNKTLLDLHFSESGGLTQFTVLDDEINAQTNSLQNPAALYALQNRINQVKQLETFATLKELPEHSIRDADYPFIYSPPSAD